MKGKIYKITNIKNNKVYIGSSKNIERRFYQHLLNLNNNNHINKHLQNAWNKYGEYGFKFEIIREVNLSILRKAEQFYINIYKSLNPTYGYNKTVVVHEMYNDLESIEKTKNTYYFGCYTKNGKLFKVFRTIDDVYLFLKGRYTGVYDSCNSNLTKTCKNYYWLRLDVSKTKFQNQIQVNVRKGRHRKILQCDLNGNMIKEWSSAVEAAKKLGLSSFNITRCLKKNNLYKQFKWFYSAP